MIGLSLLCLVLAIVAFVLAPIVDQIGHVILVSAIGAGLLGAAGALLAGYLVLRAGQSS